MGIKRGSSHRVVLALLIAFAVFVMLLCSYLVHSYITIQRRFAHLLSETDYQAVLDACRELSNRVTIGDLKTGTYWVRYDNQPKIPKLPQVILDIEPAFVYIDREGWVMLEVGGIPHYGLVAYIETSKADSSIQADIELIPGLWYYDEDYRDEYPRLQKRIDELIQKGKMRQKEKNEDSANNEK